MKILILIVIFLLGCSEDIKESTRLNFNVEDQASSENLNINLYTYKNYLNSRWYGLVKKETIINQGKLVKNSSLNSDRKSTRLNSSHSQQSRMPSSA